MDRIERPANDNRPAFEPFLDYNTLARAVAPHFDAAFLQPDDYPPAQTMISVIQRTNSAPALRMLIQKINGKSLSELATTFIEDVFKPISVDENSPHQFSDVDLEQCARGVLGETLDSLLDPPRMISKDLALRWRVSSLNHLDPRHMKEPVRRYREQIIEMIREYDFLFGVLINEAQRRIIILDEVSPT